MAFRLSAKHALALVLLVGLQYALVSADPIVALSNETTTESSGHTEKEERDQCESNVFPCSNKIVGNLILILIYGAILGIAAKMISDGAEMLLDLNLPPAIVGGVVLPVMGAVPDSVMILFSGIGDPKEAQQQISVGMGTLAGSTILLLTIAWGVSLIVGRTDIVRDRYTGRTMCSDVCSPGFDPLKQGVQVSRQVMFVAIGMIISVVPLVIVQASDWYFGPTLVKVRQPTYVRKAALATMIIALVGFVAYLAYQVYESMNDDDAKVNVLKRHRRQKMLAHAAHRFMSHGQARRSVFP